MTTPRALVAAACLACALPASAQLAPRSIALEVLGSAPLARGAPAAHAAQALTATVWLDGAVEVVARVASGTAPRTEDRGAARWYGGTAGLRWSLAPGPVRPQLAVEAGWGEARGGGARLLLGAEVALEWFPRRDVAVRVAGALRTAAAAPGGRGELGVAGVLYF